MWHWLGIASITAFVAFVAHNLGLIGGIHSVCGDIVKCQQCTICWTTFIVLMIMGCNVMLAFALAIVLSYLSNWFGLFWVKLSDLYERLWQRIMKQR